MQKQQRTDSYPPLRRYAAGLTALLGDDSDDGGVEFDFDEFDDEDDSDDDADPKKEIDLDAEDSKRPKKKQRR